MRRFLVVLMAAMVLSGCVEMMDNGPESVSDEPVAEESMDKDPEKIETNSDNKLIDLENPLDERDAIEKSMMVQRDVLKPGFVTDDLDVMEIQVRNYVMDDAVRYRSVYKLPEKMSLLCFEANNMYTEDFYEELIKEFRKKKELNHKQIDGVYGLFGDGNYPSYDLWGMDDDFVYNISIGNEKDVDTEKLLGLMGKTLKSEDSGAYDPFYENFTLNLDDVKFPKLSAHHADLDSTMVSIDAYEGMNSAIELTYRIGGSETIYYFISENEGSLYENLYEKVEECELESGIVVTEYKDESRDDRLFSWADGTYFYEFELRTMEKSLIETEDIFDIINSAMQDDREFANEDVFEQKVDKPKLGKNEKAVQKMFE